MLNIRRGAAKNGPDIAGVVQVATGRAATGNIASTTGIRGLSSGELSKAPFSEPQIKQLETYTVSADQARQFAAKNRRPSRQVETLPNPAKG
ncbi:MAG: SH3 type 3 domain protein [Halothiobacillaceae bacterium]|nr:MAG: SH3 type 3 domain protein [Halothiobacillaceae bacterium]